ncbi:MAG TPA: alpha/beta fold hydrolase [Steroidobacteraceae bacterium]|nr:alpha/beta fold hydrolase [Steroidobacteraceae bacterium]
MSKRTPNAATDIGSLKDDAVVTMLASGRHADAFRLIFGELEYAELHRLARRVSRSKAIRKTRVYILPGIMGSALGVPATKKSAQQSVWLNPLAIARGELLDMALPDERRLQPLGVLLPGYLKLKLLLQLAGFDAVFQPFDWRRSVEHSARELLRRIARERRRGVHIVAHSMGGLVARAALAVDRQRRIGKIVQLGTPNAGSFAPVQALRAVYATVRKIAALDPNHSAEQLARHVFRSLPGLYELLPASGKTGALDLFQLDNWPTDLLGPDATLLVRASRARAKLAPGREGCYHIVGVNQETIISVAKKGNGFEYRIAADGDSTVPRALANWPGAKNFFVDELHSNLTKNDTVVSAVVDLLKKGRTNKVTRDATGVARIVRRTTDANLRKELRGKVAWDRLPFDERRNILDATISTAFLGFSQQRRLNR